MATQCQETLGSGSAQELGIAAEPVDPAASSGDLLVQSNVVNVDDVTVSTAQFAQSAARSTFSVLPLLTQQQVPSASVAVSNVFDVSVASAIVRARARADRPGVHMTDQAYDSEISAYFRDDSPFYYGPSPPGATLPFASVHSRADSRQSRTSYRSVSRQPCAPSRQSVMSVRSHASGPQSTRSQAVDPFVELMRGVFDHQRADADRRKQQMQVRVDAELSRRDAEFARREKDAIDKTRLQLRVEQLEKEAAAARPAITQRDSVTPAVTGAPQSNLGDTHTLMTSADSHSPPPPTADSVTYPTAGALVQPTAVTRDAHSLALSAPAPADTHRATQPVPDSLMVDHPHRQLIDIALVFMPLMSAPAPPLTDYTLPPTVPDMTVATSPPRVQPRTPALLPYSSMYAVNVDSALSTVSSSLFSTMTVDRCDLPMPLYTAPSTASAVTSVVPTVVHTSSSLGSGAYVSQAPAVAFITHPSLGPAVAFPLGTCPGWGNAAIPMEYPNPAPALPIPVMGKPTVSMVDPASTLFGTLPTSSLLPLLTDTTSTTTTAVTSAVDSVFSELAPGLKFLALAPRPFGVATYPDGQALPVPAATTPAVQPPTATTPAAV